MWGVSVSDSRVLWSLHRALHHVHLGWDPPSATLAVLLTPSGTRHRNFLQSRAGAASRELPFAAVSWPCLNSLHWVERDRTLLKAIFDSRALPDAVPLCLCGHVAPGHIPVATSTCPSWSQLRGSQMTSPNPALPAPPHHLHDLLSLVVL